MTNVAISNSFVSGTTILASAVNTNFSDLVTWLNNRNTAVTSWDGGSFAAAVSITPTTNQIVLGTTRTVTISAATPASSSRIWSVPDITADGTFAALEGTQTFSGTKTFSAAPVISALTASTVPYLDSGKVLTSSAVTPTELGYVSGVSSALQTQLGLKAPLASPTFTGVVTTANGAVGAPAINLGDATTGLYRSASNVLATAVSGVKTATFTAGGASDDVTYTPLNLFWGTQGASFSGQTTTAITTAKAIYTGQVDVAFVIVSGDSSGTALFFDLVVYGNSVFNVVSTNTILGSPAARTYSVAGGTLKVAMASGTYKVTTFGMNVQAH